MPNPWSLPEDSDAERANERRIASDYRSEANEFRREYYAARDAQLHPNMVEALRQSAWMMTELAAEAERKSRRIQ